MVFCDDDALPAAPQTMGAGGCEKIQTRTGKTAVATTEPRGTERPRTKTTAKTTIHNTSADGASSKKAPQPVAMPLPPRNLIQTGKQ